MRRGGALLQGPNYTHSLSAQKSIDTSRLHLIINQIDGRTDEGTFLEGRHMPDIRYICLSDMHFGAYNSLLTNLKVASPAPDPGEPSPVLEQLVRCMEELVSLNENQDVKPVLVLNGDILELALATTNQAAMAFMRFIDLIIPETGEPLIEKIIYVPGNHDHHLWEIARETQYLNHIGGIDPGERLPVPWHASNMFEEGDTLSIPAPFLMGLIKRLPHLSRKRKLITSFYPNYGILASDRRRAVVFHHGHFTEGLYQIMSTLRTMVFPDREPPVMPWDIEAENFAWIDFFWSAMGRSGEVGKDIGLLYECIQDERARRRILRNLSRSLAERYDLPGWGDWMETKVLDGIFGLLSEKVNKLERLQIEERPLSREAQRGLWTYVEGPLKEQIMIERKQDMPTDVTIVFGHTHKPFSADYDFEGYNTWVDTYNTGGWVVDTVDPAPAHGAAIVLLDENLNGTSVRLYNESDDEADYRVRLEQAQHPGEGPNPLFAKLNEQVDPDADPWKSFGQLAAITVDKRAQHLRRRINAQN
jgi:hypothetical protein